MTRRQALLLPLPSLAMQSPPAPPGTVRVEGKVVDSFTNMGVPEALVVLWRVDRGPAVMSGEIWNTEPSTQMPAPDLERMAARTDGNGGFRFVVEAPAQFRLMVRGEGYVSIGGNPGLMFNLKPGADRADIAIPLQREGSISGRVIDIDTREPVAGIAVLPMRQIRQGGGSSVIPAGDAVRTGREGQFMLPGLLTGEYLLQVRQPLVAPITTPSPDVGLESFQPLAYGVSWYPGVEHRDQASTLHLLPASSLDGLEIRVSKTPVYVIRGRLGNAPENAMVVLFRLDHEGGMRSYATIARAEVEPGAGFQCENLTPGNYAFTASAGSLKARAPVEIVDRHVDGVQLHPVPGVTVTGLVRLPAKDAALPEAELSVRPALHLGAMQLNEPGAPVAADGSFKFEGVPGGSYSLNLWGIPKGYGLASSFHNGAPLVHRQFTIDPGVETHRIELVLAPATASLRVSVTDGPRSAPGAFAVVVREPVVDQVLEKILISRECDADGIAEFTGLLAGGYRLLAFPAATLWRNDSQLVPKLATGKELKIGEGEMIQMQVRIST